MVDVVEKSKYAFSEDELKLITPKTAFNINVGVLGHIDSGKTSVCRELSVVTSTASLDKSSQSQERGITLDLGFSAFFTRMPERLKPSLKSDYLQFTLVDCPGHASLIKTIIGGASIIDIMFLIIDVNKGIQTQTAECLVIGELLNRKVIVVLNKIDQIPIETREETVQKKKDQLRKIFSKTRLGPDVPMVGVSASQENPLNIDGLIDCLVDECEAPVRTKDGPFLLLIDHCFQIKGKGSVVTGTVISGTHKVGEELEFPLIHECRKSKSIQMFKKPVDSVSQGDRAGILFTQLDSNLIERGIACSVGITQFIEYAVIPVNKVMHFKCGIQSKAKFHVTTGHQTSMASIKLFKAELNPAVISQLSMAGSRGTQVEGVVKDKKEEAEEYKFDQKLEYEYVESYDDFMKDKQPNSQLFALLEFEKPVCVTQKTLFICSKFDTDITANLCRIAFYGNLLKTFSKQELQQAHMLKIVRQKVREGIIEKVNDDGYSVIVKDMFKKETKIELFVNKQVDIQLTSNPGKIVSAFGKSGKVKVSFQNGVYYQPPGNGDEEKKEMQLTPENAVGQVVLMKYNKSLFFK